MKKTEDWIVFYGPDGKELSAVTVCGTFSGEIAATKELLAYEKNLPPDRIVTRIVNR